MSTISQTLQWASKELSELTDTVPQLEAEVLLSSLLGVTRSHLFAWPEQALTAEQERDFQGLVERRQQGEPIAYLTGQREFWSLILEVTSATLIPRPETELLVAWALELVPAGSSWKIADLGTGCGAIAAALATEISGCRIVATDSSPEAISVAEANFSRLRLENITAVLGDWYEALPPEERYDLIVTNPPYVAVGDPCLQQGDLPREPLQALVSGHDGLDDIRRIIEEAPPHMADGGWLLLEHGAEQGEALRHLLDGAGFSNIETRRDLAGLERVTGGNYSGTN
jgi:release factor glutamine methyltransferase